MSTTAPRRFALPLALVSACGLVAAVVPGPRTVPIPARQQQATFRVHPVAGAVSYLEGAGGNIGLCLGAQGLVVVDTQLDRFREQVLAAIAGVDGSAPRYVLNTHHHGDHVGNNEPLGERRVPIVAHENVRRRMASGGNDASPAAALPTLTFSDRVLLHLGGEQIEMRHVGPGHTDGDSVVFFRTSKVLHMGDLFFNGSFPFIDVQSGGSPSGYAAAVEGVLGEVDEGWKIIPGHGPLASRADLERFLAVLRDCIERVRDGLAEGSSVQEMQDSEIFGDYEGWGSGFISAERFVADLAAGLEAEGR